MRFIVDDAELSVLDEGSGTPIVLLHGFPFSKETWDAQAVLLRREARVVRLDLRGLGASRGGPGPHLMEALAGDVAAVLDALGIERAVVAGHSLGTYVAFAFFRMFEERVLGLGLVCGRADADTPDAAARRLRLAELAERDGMAPVVDDFLPRFFTDEVRRERPEVIEAVRTTMLATDPSGAAATLRGMAMRSPSYDLFEAIRVPVSIVAGRDDAVVPRDRQTEMADGIAGASLSTLACGHLPQLEAPEALAAELEGLLRAVAVRR